jgi:hypothetical protein
MKYVGLSLSGCISDIVRGNKHLEDVVHILAGTKIENQEGLAEVCARYHKSNVIWNLYSVQTYLLAFGLWQQGRIIQPRLLDGKTTPNPSNYLWLEYDPIKHGDGTNLCPECRSAFASLSRLCIKDQFRRCTCCDACRGICSHPLRDDKSQD